MSLVEAQSFDQVPLDGTASFDSARSMLRSVMCASGPGQMAEDASFAVEQEPSWSPWRDTALFLLAHAHLLEGDVDQASVVFGEALALGTELGNTDTVVGSEAELALMAMERGRWEEAAERIERALVVVDENRMYDYAASLLAFAVAARLAVHDGDPEEADRQLTRAMRARPSCTYVLPFLAVRGRLQLAKAFASRGDPSSARHVVREIDEVLLHRPALGALAEQVAEFREVLTSTAQVGAVGASPLTPAELRLLPYLQTHLTIGEIGDRLFVSRNTVSSEVGLDLPQARRLVTQRRCAAGHDDRPARRIGTAQPPVCSCRASSTSYPIAIASFGAAATTRGNPTTGIAPIRTSTISATVAPASSAASA